MTDGWGVPPVQTPPPWVLRCALCLHISPGNASVAAATPAVTVMNGLAVCEEHIDLMDLPTDIEEVIYQEDDPDLQHVRE